MLLWLFIPKINQKLPYIALYFYAATPVIAKKPIKSREIFEKSVDFDYEVRYTGKQLSKLWRTTSALR